MDPYSNPAISRFLSKHNPNNSINNNQKLNNSATGAPGTAPSTTPSPPPSAHSVLIPKLASSSTLTSLNPLSPNQESALSCDDFFSNSNTDDPNSSSNVPTPVVKPASPPLNPNMNHEERQVFLNDDSLIPPSSMSPLTETRNFLDRQQQQQQQKKSSYSNLTKLQSMFICNAKANSHLNSNANATCLVPSNSSRNSLVQPDIEPSLVSQSGRNPPPLFSTSPQFLQNPFYGQPESATSSSRSKHKSYGLLQDDQHLPGEYLPEIGFNRAPSFPSEDYLDVVSTLSPDQIQALPFSIRRKVKSVLSGSATETDVRNISQNLDSIMHYASTAEPPSQENSDCDTSADPTPTSSTPAMAIRPGLNPLPRASPGISPNTSAFFGEPNNLNETLLSPSSQSLLRAQQPTFMSPREYSDNPVSFFIPNSHRRLHRAATSVYPPHHSNHSSNSNTRHNSISASTGANRNNLSRSASLSFSSSSNNSPALQYLTRFASNTFSPGGASEAGSFAANGEEMGQEIGDYVIGKQIGYGGFSQVKEAHTITKDGVKETLAVKIVHKVASNAPTRNPDMIMARDTASADRLEQIQNEFDHEVSLWKTLDHPNILKLLSVHEDETATYCFTNKITGGTLFDLVKKTHHKGLQPSLAIHYTKQLASALLYLHDMQSIVHRDVKPENCLIEEEQNGDTTLVLCDFGMSDYFDNEILTGIEEEEGENDDNEDGDEDDEMHSDGDDRFRCPRKIGPSETSSILNQYHVHQSPSAIALKKNQVTSPSSSTRPSRQNSLFGGAALSSCSTTDQNIGSLPYASPELLESSKPIFSPTVDIWAYGVLVYSMFRGHLPWNHAFAPKLRELIIKGEWAESEFEEHVRDRVNPSDSNSSGSSDKDAYANKMARWVLELVRGCLEVDIATRFTIRQIVDHLGKYQEITS